MEASGIQVAQNVYVVSTSTRTTAYSVGEDKETSTQPTDTVEISQEAKDLATSTPGATDGIKEQSSNRELPLEAYSIPEWYAELLSDYAQVDTEIGVPYTESRAAKYDALSVKEKNDLAEYQGIVHKYFQEELSARGIETNEDYYAQIVQDPKKSEEVHQAVKQKLMGDAWAMQTMQYFGVSI